MEKIQLLNSFLSANKIQAVCTGSSKQGSVDVFDLHTHHNFRLNKLSNLTQEIMLALKAYAPPSLKMNFDENILQLEILSEKNKSPNLIDSLVADRLFSPSDLIPMVIGSSLKGEDIIVDMSKNPHLLIGGTTGSGKSSLIHNIICNLLLLTNAELHIVDTKAIEYFQYLNISKRVRLVDNCYDYKKLLSYLLFIMNRRYEFMKKQNIELINDHFKPMVLVIDEFADLIMQDKDKSSYLMLCQLVQKCRAAGIYCVLATQRPSVDIITGVIKANFPARIACRVASKTDSRVVLDNNGAEQLHHIGDAIINNYKYNMQQFQISYSSPKEIENFFKCKN